MADIQITAKDLPLDDASHVAKLIKFTGQLDETNVDQKSQDIYSLIEALPDGGGIVFDFSDLEYMNSKSIGYVNDWFAKIQAKNGQLVITQARENILDILSVVGVDQIIPITSTLDEAKAEILK